MGMQELLVAQAKTESTLSTIGDKVEMLDEAIRGNGKPGINQRLSMIETHIKRMDYWAGVLVKILLPLLLTTLAFGVTTWVQSVR